MKVQDNIAEASVVFVERGLDASAAPERLVWLSSMPTDEPFLDVPISLTKLYHMLEEDFFPSPRRHIRVPMACEAYLQVHGAWLPVTLVSLSDRGGRFKCASELSRKQLTTLEMTLDRRNLRLPAEVLYTIPAGDTPGREDAQFGVLFKPLDEQICDALRLFIERTCVARACAVLELKMNDPSLSWIDVATDPWAGLF